MAAEAAYAEYVKDALKEVRAGQHLRFIPDWLQTKEVCLAALLHETSHTSWPHDIGVVPAANLDWVVARVKEARPSHASLHAYLDKRAAERKERASQPGYYDFDSLQGVLDHWGADTWDDMQKKRFVKGFDQ